MRTSVANYDTYNDADYKRPVWAISFEVITGLGTFGYRTVFVSDEFADFASPPSGTTFKKYLKNVSVVMPNIDLVEPSLTPGSLQFELVDVNAEVTALLNSVDSTDLGLFSQTVTAKMGYYEIDYDEFVDLPTFTVISAEVDNSLGIWRIKCRDDSLQLTEGIFKDIGLNPATLNGGITSGSASLTINSDGGGYIDPTTFFNNADNRVKAALKIDSEVMTYTAINYGTGEITGLTRAQGNSVADAHADGATVYPGIAFYCNPMRILLHLLMTSNTTSAGTVTGKYDLGAPKISSTPTYRYWIGLGIDASKINVGGIERIGWKIFDNDEYDDGYFFLFDEVQNALDFIQSNLLKQSNAFIKYGHASWLLGSGSSDDVSGKIDVTLLDWVDFVENFSSAFTFDDSKIIRDTFEFETLHQEAHGRINLIYGYDHGAGQGEYSVLLTLPESYPQYYNSPIVNLTHYGLASANDADQVENIITHRFMMLWDAPVLASFRAKYETNLIEPGDKVLLTATNAPDISDGSLTWTNKKAIISSQRIAFPVGAVDFEARTWDVNYYAQDELSGLYAINKIAEGDIDDKALTVSADETATTEAADAYYDNSVTAHKADRIIFKFRLTEPAFGGGSTFETIKLKVSALSAVPAIINSNTVDDINFNPQGDDVILFEIDLVSQTDGGETPDSVKVDWISTTAAGSEVPTVEFIGVWFVLANSKYAPPFGT